MIIISILIMKI